MVDGWIAGEPQVETAASESLRKRLLAKGVVHPCVTPVATIEGVGFVIPVRDDPGGLERLLRSIRGATADSPVVVVDDGSRDPAEVDEMAARWDVMLLRHPIPKGPGAARNTGVRHLIGRWSHLEVVFFLDADTDPRPRAVATVVAHFADPDVDAVAARVRGGSAASTIARYEAGSSPLDLGDHPAVVLPGSRVSYVPSAALAVRVAVFERCGGFDERLRFGEDVDLVWRLIDDGAIVRYEPAAVVDHRDRERFGSFARQRFSYGSSAADLAARHRNKVAPLQLPANVVGAVLLMVFGSLRLRLVAVAVGAVGMVRLARRLEGRVDSPAVEAVRLGVLSHRHALGGLATAATRTWAPVLLASRPTRRVLGAALVLPALLDWVSRRPANDPVTHTVVRAVDHISYCAGVWAGALRSRSVAALLPSVRFRSRSDD